MNEVENKIMTLEEPEEIAVPAPSFWLSQANTEFNGNRWASNVLVNAKLPAPQWLSNLAGKSNIITYTLPSGSHNNVDVSAFISMTAGNIYNIIVPSNASYRATSTGVPALRCVGSGTITLTIQSGATIYGRGGNGGNGQGSGMSAGTNGGAGGPAIARSSNVNVANSGSVAGGGGGGGGGGWYSSGSAMNGGGGGGGGADYGAAGAGGSKGGGGSNGNNGAGGSASGAGGGGAGGGGRGGTGGAGGGYGANGANGDSGNGRGGTGGAAGAAIIVV